MSKKEYLTSYYLLNRGRILNRAKENYRKKIGRKPNKYEKQFMLMESWKLSSLDSSHL